MKILFWGNSGNGSYQLAKIFQKEGIHVELYMMSYDKHRSNPLDIDKELQNYPSWIHQYQNDSFSQKVTIKKDILEYINSNFDIVITVGLAVANSYLFKIPVVIYPTGGELNADPFFSIGHFARPWNIPIKLFLIYSIRKANKIFAGGTFIPDAKAYERLRHKGIINIKMPVDSQEHLQFVDLNLKNELNQKYASYKIVIMWFTRVNMDKNRPSYKAPELFLQAVFKFLSTHPNVKIVYGRHGTELSEFEKMIQESGYSSYFESVPHMEYWKLQTYLAVKNAVVVETMMNAGGNMSNMARDCLALQTTMITNYDDDILAIYPEAWPILRVNNAEELLNQLNNVYAWNETEHTLYKQQVRNWFDKYMDARNVTKDLITHLKFVITIAKYKTTYWFPFSLLGKNKA